MRTLIVEDNGDKRQRICAALGQVPGFNVKDITHAPDIFTARREVLETAYDLMILDIALPARSDEPPREDAGIQLLEEMLSRGGKYNVPAHVIGMTAYPEIYEREAGRFASRLLTLVCYDPAQSEWEHGLQARVRHILDAATCRANEARQFESDIAVVCALDSPELTSLLRLPWKWVQHTMARDHTIYWRGEVVRGGGIVHAAAAARMGMPATAVLAMKMIEAFRPRVLAMIGMAAGVRGRVNMGDVIAADPCWDWGSGKWIVEGGQRKFLGAPRQIPLSVTIREWLRNISYDKEMLAIMRSGWPAEVPAAELQVHIGPMASGASVLADRETATRITGQHRELLGIDMEAYGLYVAAEEASEPRPTAVSVKAVVDFADGDKDDRYQAYAAYVSSMVLRSLAEKIANAREIAR